MEEKSSLEGYSPENNDRRIPGKQKRNYKGRVESEWSNPNIFQLINEVQSHRGIWDIGSEEYKHPKIGAWNRVAAAMAPHSLSDCKGKWAGLRTTFKRKVGERLLGVTDFAQWPFFNAMTFLEDGGLRPAGNAAKRRKRSESVHTISSNGSEAIQLDNEWSLMNDASEEPTPIGDHCTTAPVLSLLDRALRLSEQTLSAKCRCNDADSRVPNEWSAFGDWIASEFRAIPDSDRAREAKRKVSRFVIDTLEELHSKRQSPPPVAPEPEPEVITSDYVIEHTDLLPQNQHGFHEGDFDVITSVKTEIL